MTTKVLALAGKKGSGKDTLAEMLAPRFRRISFADAIYAQVEEAYRLPNQDLLRNRDTKETPTLVMSLANCRNHEFVEVAMKELGVEVRTPLSPRQVLQIWGTEYGQSKFGKTVWTDIVIEEMVKNPDQDYCIPDLRFPHEYKALNEYSEATGVDLTVALVVRDVEDDLNSGHISENALSDMDIFDVVLLNEEGAPDSMTKSLKNQCLV